MISKLKIIPLYTVKHENETRLRKGVGKDELVE